MRAGQLIVRLPESSIDDVERAAMEGIRRRFQDCREKRLGYATGGRFMAKDWLGLVKDIHGAMAEFFFSKFMGVPWNPESYDFDRGADICGFDVRGTDEPNGKCPVRPWEEPGKTYAFVVIETFLRARVCGWIKREDAERKEWASNPNDWGPAWFVPQEHLNLFEGEVADRWKDPELTQLVRKTIEAFTRRRNVQQAVADLQGR